MASLTGLAAFGPGPTVVSEPNGTFLGVVAHLVETGTASIPGGAGKEALIDEPSTLETEFKPFVLVRIFYDTENYTGGEVLGVSNNGEDHDAAIAVGYLNTVCPNPCHPQPFMFEASTATVTMLNMDNGTDEFDYGQATAITPDGAHIAGWAHEVSGNIQAVVWDAPNYIIDKSLSPANGAMWNAVEANGAVAGVYPVSSHTESVVEDGIGPYYPESGHEGMATGINSSGEVCGTYLLSSGSPPPTHAYRWDTNGNMDIHPSGTQYQDASSGANCINGSNDIGGWVTNGSGKHMAAHWAPLTAHGVLYTTEVVAPSDQRDIEVVAINSNREMIINDVGGSYGIAIWTHNSHANEAHPLVSRNPEEPFDRILTPNPDDVMSDAWCVNDELWIGGSYLVHDDGPAQPCLAIPYDTDNNGCPDFRDIVESGTSNGGLQHFADDHGFTWLLDASENAGYPEGGMRVGLDRPGYADDYTPAIENTQVVRLQVGVYNANYPTGTIGDEDFYINGIMAPSNSQCDLFEEGINLWYTDGDTQAIGREIVLMLRSNLDEEDPDHDFLPDSHVLGQGVTKNDLLGDLHEFAYKFCRCVDWIQLGNESFSSSDQSSHYGGHGGYLIYSDQLSGSCWGGGAGREFETIPVNPASCFGDAIGAVQDWHYDQMWAILEGSALAGRPLRIISPAIPEDTILTYFEQDTSRGWNEIDQTASWCNDYQVWFDMHNHYLAREDVSAAIYYLTSGGNPAWTYPWHVVCLELAPKLDDQNLSWWTGGADDAFPKFFDCNETPPSTWETYISGWQDAQFHEFSDFGISDAVGYLFDKDFTVVCYGSTLQLPEPDPLYDLAAIRAQHVCGDFFDPNQGHQTDHLTPLSGIYVTAASAYQIEEFEPHDGCDVCGN